MPVTKIHMSLTEDATRKLDELCKEWGGIANFGRSPTIVQCIERAHEQEFPKPIAPKVKPRKE